MMKRLLPLLMLGFMNMLFSQNKIHIPKAFKLNASYFSPMKLTDTTIIKKETEGLLTLNPIQTQDSKLIDLITEKKYNTPNIKNFYAEFYSVGNRRDKGGLYIVEYHQKEQIKTVLNTITQQDNFIILTKDKYLIFVWADFYDFKDQLFKKTTNYYQNLGFKKVMGRKD